MGNISHFWFHFNYNKSVINLVYLILTFFSAIIQCDKVMHLEQAVETGKTYPFIEKRDDYRLNSEIVEMYERCIRRKHTFEMLSTDCDI